MRKVQEEFTLKEGLKRFLGRYGCEKRRKDQLECRLSEIKKELNSPLKGISYEGVKVSGGISEGAASLILKIDEIECRIIDQRNEMGRTISEILDVLDYLDPESYERSVMEMRYIDGLKWEEIENKTPYQHAAVNAIWNSGIRKLIAEKKVRDKITEFMQKENERK